MAKSGSAADVISLPKGGGALSGLGETFAPDLFTGTGNLTVPIALPSGRSDLQPTLNLAYSTGHGNGPFGLGWSLSVPGVTRKTSKGVPRYRDAEDTFLLSGAEDLIPIAGQFPDPVTYRPRTEGLFAGITFHQAENRWDVRTTDGLVSHYGHAPGRPVAQAAIIADPNTPEGSPDRRVFAWHLVRTEDTFGNRIEYDYVRDEDADGAQRWSQLYLSRIRYVNYDGPLDADGNPPFLVSVTFNHGRVDERPDHASDHRAGFEIRTRLRCTSIAVETHADTPRLVRTYDFTYVDQRLDLDPDEAPLNAASLLSTIRVVGHDLDRPIADDQHQAMAPLEFRYSTFVPDAQRFFDVEGRELPTQMLASPDLALVDLSGNGLPDILEMNGVVRFWRNLGQGRFDLPRTMREAPAGVSLTDAGVQLIDANGDGRLDLLVTSEAFSGYFPSRPGGQWDRRSFQPFDAAPSFDLDDQEVALVDLDGDGVTDALRSGTRLEHFFNDPHKGWTSERTRFVPRRADLSTFPDVTLSDPRVRLADLSGDGLQDIVLLHDGHVDYWPNLGHGDWGPRVQMRDSPRFPAGYDPRRILLGDVDGDGLADLVYVDHARVLLFINQAGKRWTGPIEILGTPDVTDPSAVRLVDLLGSGVSGVLWSLDADGSGRPHLSFLDFTGGVKPYLLDEIDNHLGSRTHIEYSSSTTFFLADEENPATRWLTTLPFPVQVVSRVDVRDHFSKSTLTTEYTYHHGHWDGAEREFRGFGRVDKRDAQAFDASRAGDLAFSPPTELRTWFHLGPVGEEFGEWIAGDFSDPAFHRDHREYFAGDPTMLPALAERLAETSPQLTLPASLSRRAARDAVRTLRGHALRTELYARDGSARAARPFTVAETLYGVRRVDGADGVFFPHAIATRTTEWERGDDPMSRFAFTEDYDDVGQPRRTTQIACPRGWRALDDAPGAAFLATQTRTTFAMSAPDSPTNIRNRVATTTSFDVLNASVTTLLDLKSSADRGDARQVIGQTLHFYDGDAFEGLPIGAIGAHGACVRSESLIATEAIFAAAYRDDDATSPSGPLPPYLDPSGAPSAIAEYPAELVAEVADMRGLAGFTFGEGDDVRVRGYFACSARNQFDVQIGDRDEGKPVRGLLFATRDPIARDPAPGEAGSRDTRIEYDQFDLLPIAVTDPVGLVTRATYDPRVLQPSEVTDPNGNRIRYTYTPLGLLETTAVMGKPEQAVGDTDDVPGTRFEYGLLAFEESVGRGEAPQPIFVHSVTRVHHVHDTHVPPAERDDIIETREYSDGFSRLLQTRTLAEDLTVGDPVFGVVLSPDQSQRPASIVLRARQGSLANVIVSGDRRYDNKGRVIEQFQPYVDLESGFAYQPPTDAQRGRQITSIYDALGRVIATRQADGSESRVVFGVPGAIGAPDVTKLDDVEPTPWETFSYDANDLAAEAAAHHRFTPSSVLVDALGRPATSTERNRAAPEASGDPLPPIVEQVTRSEYDIRGNVVAIVDARERRAFEYVYDLANHPLRSFNIDGGVRRVVLNGSGDEIERRDRKGALILQMFDRLHRLTRLWARDDAREPVMPTLRQRLEYGDGGRPNQDDDARAEQRAQNRLGALHRHHDEAGLLELLSYDFKGNVLDKRRRMIRDDAILAVFPDGSDPDADWHIRAFRVDWDPLASQEAALLDDDADETSTTYDALNRVTTLRYPRDVTGRRRELTPIYNRAGALVRLTLDDAPIVEHVAHDADGQRTFVAMGNGVLTLHAYDPLTSRLARLFTAAYTRQDARTFALKPLDTADARERHLHQDYGYTYDPAGNLTALHDRTPNCGIPNTRAGLDALDRAFEYDALDRLISATGRECDFPPSSPFDGGPRCTDITRTRAYRERYVYDVMGTVLQVQRNTSATRDFTLRAETNQLDSMRVGSTIFSYVHDRNGNVAQETESRHFEWDHSDRLKAFRTQTEAADGTAAEPSVHAHYLYDAAGVRVKTLVRKQGGLTESTESIDGLHERHRTTDTERSTIHVMDGPTRIVTLVGDADAPDDPPVVAFELADHLGSSNVLVDAIGDRVCREEYGPYGDTTFGSRPGKRFRFTGQECDDESGLRRHGVRYYAPWHCGWMSVDPKQSSQPTWTPYGYAAANPLRYRDATGLQPDETTAHLIERVERFGRMKEALEADADFANDRISMLEGDMRHDRRRGLSEESIRRRHGAERGRIERGLQALDERGNQLIERGNRLKALVEAEEARIGEKLYFGSAEYRVGHPKEALDIWNKQIGKAQEHARDAARKLGSLFRPTIVRLPPNPKPPTDPNFSKAALVPYKPRGFFGKVADAGKRLLGKAGKFFAKYGSKALKIVPFVGWGVGLHSMQENWRQGKYTEAVLDGVGLIPVIGDAVDVARLAVDIGADLIIDQFSEFKRIRSPYWMPWNTPF